MVKNKLSKKLLTGVLFYHISKEIICILKMIKGGS